MSTFDHDFDWQRAQLPEVKRILAHHLIVEAPIEEDTQRNTDLIVLKLDTVRVACRLRRHKYLHLKDYANEFTIRTTRPRGAETELGKVLSGWGDYIFYGFANQDATALAAWVLGDLNTFRLWHHRESWAGRHPGTESHNGDGSSTFRAYRIADLPHNFVVERETEKLDAA